MQSLSSGGRQCTFLQEAGSAGMHPKYGGTRPHGPNFILSFILRWDGDVFVFSPRARGKFSLCLPIRPVSSPSSKRQGEVCIQYFL